MYAGLTGNCKKQRIKSLYGNKSKTQINAVQALLGNWDQVLKFQQEYNQGMMVGSSEKEKQYSPYVQKCAQDINRIAGKP